MAMAMELVSSGSRINYDVVCVGSSSSSSSNGNALYILLLEFTLLECKRGIWSRHAPAPASGSGGRTLSELLALVSFVGAVLKVPMSLAAELVTVVSVVELVVILVALVVLVPEEGHVTCSRCSSSMERCLRASSTSSSWVYKRCNFSFFAWARFLSYSSLSEVGGIWAAILRLDFDKERENERPPGFVVG